jgi:hypothetical protein
MSIRFCLCTFGLFTLVATLALTGCTNGGDNPDHGGDPAGGDNHQVGDNHQSGDGLAPADDFNGDFGPLDDFPIRVPGTHQLSCGTFAGEFVDVDHVCRVDHDTLHADIYVRVTPTACNGLGVPTDFSVAAFARVDTAVTQIAGGYSWGGQHHNDAIEFAIDGKNYVIWHSSTGYGFRVCAPPDCLRPCNPGVTLATCNIVGGYAVDGCYRLPGGGPPPIPVVCVQVTADGSVPPLFDPWVAQTGSPSYPLLPCLGDQGSPP